MAYAGYSVMPGQKEMQIALSLMIGVDVWQIARLVVLITNYGCIDFDGLKLHSFLQPEEVFDWAQLQRIEWWHYQDGYHSTYYRLWSSENQILATLSSSAWTRLNEGIGYIIHRKGLEPVQIKPPLSEFWQAAIVILAPLAVCLFSFEQTTLERVIGVLLSHLLWVILVRHYSRRDLRRAYFYMMLLSITVIAALAIVSDTHFEDTLIWWLYSPLIEVIASFLLSSMPRLWRNERARRREAGKV